MQKRRSQPGRFRSILAALPAFLLSAVLAAAFLGVVDKTHNLFGGCSSQAQSTWHVAKAWAQKAIGA